MVTESFNKRFFKLAIPNILANISVPLVGLVDTAMLGHLPEIHFLAGVALASVLFDYIFWTFGFLRMSTTGLTAQASGKKDIHEIYAISYRGFAIALFVGLILILFRNIISATGFGLLSAESLVKLSGEEYFAARILGAPVVLCNYVFVGWFLGRERSDLVLYMTLVGNVANVILNYIFLFILGLAAAGVGWATTISNILAFFLALVFYKYGAKKISVDWKSVFTREKLVPLFSLNRDILIRTLFLISSFGVFTNISSILGVSILAVNTIILRILSFAAYLIDGIAFATESLAGIFKGSNDHQSLKKLLKTALLWGEVFAVGFIAIMFLIPDYFYPLMTSHADIIQLLKVYDYWVYIALIFSAIAYIFDGYFLGITNAKILRNSMVLCFVVFFLPLAWLSVKLHDNHILWLAMVVFMFGRAATLGWGAWREIKIRAS
ncbi:MAG: MATE family efflux transporter [Calditrichaeota bacterium]|nr:MAG: MATE family efflux transporter [Calditrichota bacterium]